MTGEAVPLSENPYDLDCPTCGAAGVQWDHGRAPTCVGCDRVRISPARLAEYLRFVQPVAEPEPEDVCPECGDGSGYWRDGSDGESDDLVRCTTCQRAGRAPEPGPEPEPAR